MSAANEFAADWWITVQQLSEATGASVRSIYQRIYRGDRRHARRGRALRVRLVDWQSLFDGAVIEPGTYKRDPVRSERALRAAETRARRKAEAQAVAK